MYPFGIFMRNSLFDLKTMPSGKVAKNLSNFLLLLNFNSCILLSSALVTSAAGTYYKDSILSVSNSCELINKEDLNKIFDRFYRLDEARTRQKGGNGMGLSIAKAIVDKHNAKISAEIDDDNNFTMKVKFYRKK